MLNLHQLSRTDLNLLPTILTSIDDNRCFKKVRKSELNFVYKNTQDFYRSVGKQAGIHKKYQQFTQHQRVEAMCTVNSQHFLRSSFS